jgi:hypothetical protein
MKLANQIRAVLKTYLARPAFVIFVVLGLAGWAMMSAAEHVRLGYGFSVVLFLGLTLINLLPFAASLTLIGMFLLHARRQLRGQEAALTPDSRRANLLVAGTFFLVIVLVLTWFFCDMQVARTPWQDHAVSPTALFIVVLTMMTLAALSTIGSTWWLVLLVPMIWALQSRKFDSLGNLLVQDFSHLRIPARFHHQEMALERRVWLVRIAVLTFNLTALAVLAWRARPKTTEAWEVRIFRRAIPWLSGERRSRAIDLDLPHRPVISVLRRASHRRLAVHHPRFAWVVAGSLAIVLLLLTLLFAGYRDHSEIMACLAMATVIPGVIVAAGWRERWPSIAYELLYPARRDEFVSEIAVALAVDLAEFWLAAFLAAILPLAIFEPRMLRSPLVAAGFLASAMMQVPVFGVCLLMSKRQGGIVTAGVTVLILLAQLIPLLEMWSEHPALTPISLLLVALGQMCVGLVLAIAGYAAWRRAEFA